MKSQAKRPTIKNRAKLKRDGIPRAALWVALYERIVQLRLSREQAAKLVHDAASQMSRLMTGNVSEFSADRFTLMLTRLGVDIDVVVRVKHPMLHEQSKRGRVRVFRELRNGQRHEITV